MTKTNATCIILALCAGIAMMPDTASGGATSDPAVVFLRPKESFLWCTATNATISLPVVYPDGATSASLSVSGLGYSANYPDVAEGEFLLTLPAATAPSNENVYELTLTFSNGTERKAKLGLIQGVGGGAEGSTRCLAPVGSRKWRHVNGRAVLPVPYGITSFTIDFSDAGTVTESGLDGAAGWYPLALSYPGTATLGMTDADGTEWSALLNGIPGFVISFR